MNTADVRHKIRNITSDRMYEDGESGECIGVFVYLTDDEAHWVCDTFEEMTEELERCRRTASSMVTVGGGDASEVVSLSHPSGAALGAEPSQGGARETPE